MALSPLMDSGLAIKTWRLSGKNALTRELLAVKLGRCVSTIIRWEDGGADPRLSDVRHMESIKAGLVRTLFPRGKRA